MSETHTHDAGVWSWLFAKGYDRFMRQTEEACLAEWRAELVGSLEGSVLEIGAGSGANVDLYAEGTIVDLAEPDPNMRALLEERVADRPSLRVVPWSAERLEANDGSYDWVVSTLVLCTVGDVGRSLAEVRRVLRPGGGFVFMEHVAAPTGSSRRGWQDRLDPFWTRFARGCHLNRDTESAIVGAGLEIVECRRESMRKAVSLVRPTIRGVARRSP